MAEQAPEPTEVRTPVGGILPLPKSWWQRMKDRMRGSIQTEGTMQAPTAQHYEMTEAEKFKAAHGFSMASDPLPWSEDIAKHNALLNKEYNDEIAARQRLMAIGEYRPRFVTPRLTDLQQAHALSLPLDDAAVYFTECFLARGEEIRAGATPSDEEINWHMELSADPGRRVDVTKDSGRPRLKALTVEELQQVAEVGAARRSVRLAEEAAHTARAKIGSRESILDAVGGNEDIADQVEESARKFFGVEDLDAPLPVKADA